MYLIVRAVATSSRAIRSDFVRLLRYLVRLELTSCECYGIWCD